MLRCVDGNMVGPNLHSLNGKNEWYTEIGDHFITFAIISHGAGGGDGRAGALKTVRGYLRFRCAAAPQYLCIYI